jgi:hypothetical protein
MPGDLNAHLRLHAELMAMDRVSLPTARVDADFILRVLADEHRQQAQIDPEADPSVSLSLNATVADWRRACDLVAWRKLSRALNAHWEIDAPEAEWQAVLEPARERTLLDVCRFLADRVRLPQLTARGYFGAACTATSAFFGIRSALAAQGIDTSGIRPSTDLEFYTRLAPQTFVTFAARTVPGRLPAMRVETGFWVRPRRVSFGALKTFRDYAECLAGGVGR